MQVITVQSSAEIRINPKTIAWMGAGLLHFAFFPSDKNLELSAHRFPTERVIGNEIHYVMSCSKN